MIRIVRTHTLRTLHAEAIAAAEEAARADACAERWHSLALAELESADQAQAASTRARVEAAQARVDRDRARSDYDLIATVLGFEQPAGLVDAAEHTDSPAGGEA